MVRKFLFPTALVETQSDGSVRVSCWAREKDQLQITLPGGNVVCEYFKPNAVVEVAVSAKEGEQSLPDLPKNAETYKPYIAFTFKGAFKSKLYPCGKHDGLMVLSEGEVTVTLNDGIAIDEATFKQGNTFEMILSDVDLDSGPHLPD